MTERIRNWLNTTKGRIFSGLVVCVMFALVARQIFAGLSSPLDEFGKNTYICSETGKVFVRSPTEGEMSPVKSPHSGQNTGFIAEFCGWNADGTVKEGDPTPVLLNIYKGIKEPTYCPDCNRRVVAMNRPALKGDPAPPLKK